MAETIHFQVPITNLYSLQQMEWDSRANTVFVKTPGCGLHPLFDH